MNPFFFISAMGAAARMRNSNSDTENKEPMTAYQRSLLTEVALLYAYALGLVWTSTLFPTWLVYLLAFIGFVAACARLHLFRASSRDMGLCVQSRDLRWLFLGIGGVIVAAFAICVIGNMIRHDFWKDRELIKKLSSISVLYLLGVPFQQFLMHGYFTNRLDKIWPGHNFRNALAVGLLFGIAHLPNPVLSVATLIFGTATAWYFLHSRNLWFLSFAHAILSHLVHFLIAIPLIGHGSMRVGMGFWQ